MKHDKSNQIHEAILFNHNITYKQLISLTCWISEELMCETINMTEYISKFVFYFAFFYLLISFEMRAFSIVQVSFEFMV